MISGGAELWVRILFVVMLLTGLIARAGTFLQWLMRRRRRESSKLAIALRSELLALLELYEANLRLIAEGAGYLIPAKALPLVYRANLPRLTTLEAAVIPAVVTVYATNERIEALLSLRGTVGLRREQQAAAPALETFQREYRTGCAAIAAALTALMPEEEIAESAGAAADQETSGPVVEAPGT